jgi:hypothetical protein
VEIAKALEAQNDNPLRIYPYMNTKNCGTLWLEIRPLPSTLFCRMAVL